MRLHDHSRNEGQFQQISYFKRCSRLIIHNGFSVQSAYLHPMQLLKILNILPIIVLKAKLHYCTPLVLYHHKNYVQ